MPKITIIPVLLTALLAVSSCASAPQPNTAGAEAADAARDNPSRNEPAWVSSPYSVYNSKYVAAVGHGSNRTAAERAAFAALTAVFGQSVQSETSSLLNYSEAVQNGSLDVSQDTSVMSAIRTSTEMDSLIGAEIDDAWQNVRDKSWYAVAVLDKVKAAALYGDLIRGNLRLINEITTIPQNEKNTLEAFSRYRLAATVADANGVYMNVLSVIGNIPADIKQNAVKSGKEYRLTASEIAHNIPVAVKVEGDRQNRVANAFAVVFGRIGFKSGGSDNRYVLNAALELNDANLAGNSYQFSRYHIDSYLTDTANGHRMAPYNISGREGHTAMREAENRAISSATKKIDDEYETVFNTFFSTTLLE